MKFTPILALAGLAAAVPCSEHSSSSSSSSSNTAAAYTPSSVNGTAPDPSTYENVDITDFSVREEYANSTTVQSIESVYFVLNGNTTCQANDPGLDGTVFTCGETSYRFGLINGTESDFALRIYKATSAFVGWYGVGDVPTYCHTGGGSVQQCNQIVETTIVIAPPQ